MHHSMKGSVSRSVTAYDRQTEELTFEQDLAVRDFASLYLQCGAPEDDPELFDCYPIKKEDAVFFAPFLPQSFTFDFEKFDYFLEASAS
jgi:hypothetical protein